jgi:SAM-dependent methyltransferase
VKPPTQQEIAEHYASGYEAKRLEAGPGLLEGTRTRELLGRFLPPAPAIVRDVGGGPGAYACWLARAGYEVHLVDVSPVHVRLAQEASDAQAGHPIAGARVGDARALPWADASSDAVLLLGPLYHLTDRRDRLAALKEAKRVLKPGGVLLAVGISRFASALDGLARGFLDDPAFARIVDQDLEDGQHRNPTNHPHYFMETFFHHPEELRGEVAESGISVDGMYGIEGPAWLLQNLEHHWNDEGRRERMLGVVRRVESEPTLLGASAHVMVVGRKTA